MKLQSTEDLKRHSQAVGDSFFSEGNARYFGSSKVAGIYRAPYSALTEGYVIAETIFTGSDGVSAPAEYVIYRFEAAPDTLEWFPPVGMHTSLADAEAFLASTGVTK